MGEFIGKHPEIRPEVKTKTKELSSWSNDYLSPLEQFIIGGSSHDNGGKFRNSQSFLREFGSTKKVAPDMLVPYTLRESLTQETAAHENKSLKNKRLGGYV
jgi:hypothetical protein